MDGTNRRMIVSGNLGWPNGIALDTTTQTLYWVDAQLDKVRDRKLNVSSLKRRFRWKNAISTETVEQFSPSRPIPFIRTAWRSTTAICTGLIGSLKMSFACRLTAAAITAFTLYRFLVSSNRVDWWSTIRLLVAWNKILVPSPTATAYNFASPFPGAVVARAPLRRPMLASQSLFLDQRRRLSINSAPLL